jgi:hypothetical protein
MNETKQLPEYQCHKKVRAAKIMGIGYKSIDNTFTLSFDDPTLNVSVSSDWCHKHNPEAGGYYVEYEDGYTSYSPAKAFEAGYSLIRMKAEAEEARNSVSRHIAETVGIRHEPMGFAPRITKEDIEAEIVREYYFTAANGVDGADVAALREQTPNEGTSWVPQSEDPDLLTTDLAPLTLLTFCVLVMRNGFTVVGKSACASPENFNAELGRKYARENAIEEVWPLMGYELRSKLASAS